MPVSPRSPHVSRSEELFPLHIIFGAVWIMLIATFVTWNAVFYGCLHFISNFATCVGLFGVVIVALLPIVYGVFPYQVQNFKFVSLCPSIENALHKFDRFIAEAKQNVAEKTKK
jgi:hypothetical protein